MQELCHVLELRHVGVRTWGTAMREIASMRNVEYFQDGLRLWRQFRKNMIVLQSELPEVTELPDSDDDPEISDFESLLLKTECRLLITEHRYLASKVSMACDAIKIHKEKLEPLLDNVSFGILLLMGAVTLKVEPVDTWTIVNVD